MKKLLGLSPTKVFIFCSIGLILTLGSFWHHQSNQIQLDRMTVLNQASATCFNRISQTFTAIMIKDIRSPYLNRGFMGLSDECLDETLKEINPFKQSLGKGYEVLKMLGSEVHWFHEKVLKIHGPMLAGQDLNPTMDGLTSKYGKMESLKTNLMDEIENHSQGLKKIQANDEVVMGIGLLIFVVSLSLLSLQEFNRIQLKREIEREALNFLKAGQGNFGAMVDKLVDRALSIQGMPVTAQIFRDYHEEILERMSVTKYREDIPSKPIEEKSVPVQEVIEAETKVSRTSFMEILVSLQNVHSKDLIQTSDVRDVQLAVEFESFEQIMNAAMNKLLEQRADNKKIMIANQIHSDRAVITLFLAGSTFSAAELEFMSTPSANLDAVDMNLVILKEMVQEAGIQWNLENKVDRQGRITGQSIRFSINRAPKDKSKLISIMRGKKKDLARELVN